MLLLQGTSEQALVDLINANNTLPVPIEPGDLYFGKRKTLTDGTTQVPIVTQFDNEEYQGYAVLDYKRLNLSLIFKDIRPIIKEVGQTSLARLLPVINKNTGLNLQPEDIVDQSITWLGGNEEANLQFVMAPESLGYEGRFIVQFIRLRPMLSSVVIQKSLPVLTFPDPIVAGKKSMSMKSWGLDFTDDAYRLTLYRDGWRYPAEVKQLMADNGVANFPSGVFGSSLGLTVRATKDVPGANRAFTHVIVQKFVNTAEYNGDAFFHFNRA